MPLGRLDTLQDPRLVRVGQYEEGVTGRHDAREGARAVRAVAARRQAPPPALAVMLYDAGTADKIAQTLVEMVRGGIGDLPLDVTVFCETRHGARRGVRRDAAVRRAAVAPLTTGSRALRDRLLQGRFDYVMLFESSGMYNGEDCRGSLASDGRLDAVWGSRRLSVRDIEESLRLRYRHNARSGSSAPSAATCSA